MLIPALEQADKALDAAVASKSQEGATEVLVALRRTANEIAGLLHLRSDTDGSIAEDLSNLATECTSTKGVLLEGRTKNLVTATRQVREQLGALCGDLTRYATELRSTGDEPGAG